MNESDAGFEMIAAPFGLVVGIVVAIAVGAVVGAVVGAFDDAVVGAFDGAVVGATVDGVVGAVVGEVTGDVVERGIGVSNTAGAEGEPPLLTAGAARRGNDGKKSGGSKQMH